MGASFGNELYTIANLQAVNQAASIGMINIILSRITDSNFSEEESKFSSEFANFLIEDCCVQNINKIINWEANLDTKQLNQTKYAQAFINAHIDKPQIEVQVPLGIDKDLLAAAVAKTKEFCEFKDGKKLGVVIGNELFDQFITQFDVLKIIKLIPNRDLFQELPTLFYCKLKDSSKTQEFLICRGILAHEVFDGFMARSLGV